MDRNQMAVPIQPAAEQPKKSVQELENPEVKGRVFIKRKSGFAMARIVCLLISVSLSCSYKISPTTAQKEQKNFERFKIAPKEALILSGAAFIGYGTGKHFARIKD